MLKDDVVTFKLLGKILTGKVEVFRGKNNLTMQLVGKSAPFRGQAHVTTNRANIIEHKRKHQ